MFDLYRNTNSFAINYCHVACGRYDGTITLNKDSFPEFAGELMIREAGGVFYNIEEEENIKPEDRAFIGGNEVTYEKLGRNIKPLFL